MSEPQITELSLPGKVKIVVPNRVDLLTPYALQEQGDWFEDEIRFVRLILAEGQHVVDIGANYGVYTLTMAQAVGKTGTVWAFEPSSTTACYLARSIEANKYTHVQLYKSAISNRIGTAHLAISEQSELNHLISSVDANETYESVPLTTLDAVFVGYGKPAIDFIKIDAEGEERNIINGARKFFRGFSPLVQYEVKAGQSLNSSLVDSFAEIGYQSYRLVPGLNILVPFEFGLEPADPYLLNLFCCKPDRAEQLEHDGFLVKSGEPLPSPMSTGYGWRPLLRGLTYGTQHCERWETNTATVMVAELEEALAYYHVSTDTTKTAPERFKALSLSLEILTKLCERDPSHLRLSSLARIAKSYGSRGLAVRALQQLIHALMNNGDVDAEEPFLAPGQKFDNDSPKDDIGSWIFAASLEELERLIHYSSFFSESESLERLEMIEFLGYSNIEMQLRSSLIRQRLIQASDEQS